MINYNKKIFKELGDIIEIPSNLILYHSSRNFFMYPNKLANWFTPLYSNNMKDSIIKNKLRETPFWEGNVSNKSFIDYTYKLKKKIHILNFKTKNKNNKNLFLPDIIKNFTNSENFKSIKDRYISNSENNKYLDTHKNDYEYNLTYWMCKYTNIKGWIEDLGYCGIFMLCGDTSKILELVSVSCREHDNGNIKYYNKAEWSFFLDNYNNAPPPLMPIIEQQKYKNLDIINRKKYQNILTKIYYKVLEKNPELLKNKNNFDNIFLSTYVKPIIRILINTKYQITNEKIEKLSEYIINSIKENYYNHDYNKNIYNILKSKYNIEKINE